MRRNHGNVPLAVRKCTVVKYQQAGTARAVNQLQTVMLVPGNGIGQKMLAGIENLVHRGGSFREYGTHGRTDGNGRENRL
jgi:hypothetical protein